MRPSLPVEPRVGQRPADDPPRVPSHQRLVIALVGNPAVPEIAVEAPAFGIVENGQQRLAPQAPPLRPKMRLDPLRRPPLAPEPPLQPNPAVERPPPTLEREGERILEPLRPKPALDPRHLGHRHAFDVIRQRVGREKRRQVGHRPQRQTGPRDQADMRDVRMAVQKLPRRPVGRRDQRPRPPVAPPPPRQRHPLDTLRRRQERRHLPRRRAAVQMHHDRRALPCQPCRHLTRTAKRLVGQHDEPRPHAQFPFDINPMSSSCAQPAYFRDHAPQRL